MKVIVGLGNPGEKFENSRHNTGFMVVDELKSQTQNSKLKTQNHKIKFKIDKKLESEILHLKSYDLDLILAKPQTFMNDSGIAVKKIPQYLNISISQYLKNLYIVHDDLDIPLGEYKIQFGKGPKQHNGILSVEKELGTKNFWRVRIGIEDRILGYKDNRILGEKYVLEKFSKEERKILDGVIKKVVVQLLSNSGSARNNA